MICANKNNDNQLREIIFWVAIIVFPLAIGLAIYLVFKPSAFISKMISDCFGFQVSHIVIPDNWFLAFVSSYLCDMIWAFSFSSAIILVLNNCYTKYSVSFIICISIGIALELLQKNMVLSGTYDICDLIVESVGSFLSIIIIRTRYSRRKKNEKKHF